MGSRSRCTPSRETSGPLVFRSPAILSISSMKMSPWFSTRSRASFTTSSMSTSFFNSSSIRIRRASWRWTLRRFLRLGSMSCSISVMLTSGPLHPLRRLHHVDARIALLLNLDLHVPLFERPFLQLLAKLLAGAAAPLLVLGGRGGRLGCDIPLGRHHEQGAGGIGARRLGCRGSGRRVHRRQQQVEQPLLGPLFRDGKQLILALGTDHVDRRVHQLPDSMDSTSRPTYPTSRELRGLDLEEGRAREPHCQPPGDLGFP